MKRLLIVSLALSTSLMWTAAQLKAPEAGKKPEVSSSHPAAGLNSMNQHETFTKSTMTIPTRVGNATQEISSARSATSYSGSQQPIRYFSISPVKTQLPNEGSIYGISATGRFYESGSQGELTRIAVQSNSPALQYGIAPVISKYRTASSTEVEFPAFNPAAVISKANTGDKASAPTLPGDPGASEGAAVPLDGGLLMALLAGAGVGFNFLRKK